MSYFIELSAEATALILAQQQYDGSWVGPWKTSSYQILVEDTPNPLTQTRLDLSWRMPIPSWAGEIQAEVAATKTYFEHETLTEIAPGAGLRDNGDRVRFPYDQFTAATGIDKGTYLSFADVAALASNPRVQVIYDGPAAIVGIILDQIYEIDCE